MQFIDGTIWAAFCVDLKLILMQGDILKVLYVNPALRESG